MIKANISFEKCLIIDHVCVRKAYNMDKIESVCVKRSGYNPANALTKHVTTSVMNDIIKTSHIQYPVEQQILGEDSGGSVDHTEKWER